MRVGKWDNGWPGWEDSVGREVLREPAGSGDSFRLVKVGQL